MAEPNASDARGSTRRFAVGIDLGTTNTVVAFAPLERAGKPKVWPVPQLVLSHRSEARPLLPSAVYAPLPTEAIPKELLVDGFAVGDYARQRATEVSSRAILSAKSWLAHAEVDRTARILPWRLSEAHDDEAAERISPVEAARLVLEHVRRQWDLAHPDAPLAAQRVVLTVPASFDAVARELTVRAAVLAGLSVHLLEEPLAAFYDVVESAPELLEGALTVRAPGPLEGARGGLAPELLGGALAGVALEPLEGARDGLGSAGLVLVVDVGGGTTDLSMVEVARAPTGGIELERKAVGKHLLLGGDNVDLALAHLAEARIVGTGDRLDARTFASLVLACREAKERLLAPDAPPSFPIALVGRGRALVGSAQRTELTRDEVRALVLDGFLPAVGLEPAPPVRARAAVVAFGLPYERETAITRHVAAFVREHGMPSALLLNGGLFHAAACAERIHAVLAAWGGTVACLPAPHPELAVARGAVVHALAEDGLRQRIRSRAARAYYLGIAGPRGERLAVCVLPRGADDGEGHRTARTFHLVLGRKVRFELHAADAGDAVSAIVALDPDVHHRLCSLGATLGGAAGASVPVEIEATSSAVGTLEVTFHREDDATDARHALSFELAGSAADLAPVDDGRKPANKRVVLGEEAIARVFERAGAPATERETKDLVRELERLLGARQRWDVAVLRPLFDVLASRRLGRKQSPHHERIFWQLAGFTLRPGVGASLDAERVEGLFRLFGERLAYAAERRGWQQFFIAWRRFAAGLSEAHAARLRDVLDPFLAPKELGLRREKQFKNEEHAEMLELASSLERVDPRRRAELGSWIVERTWTDRDPRLWSALGRTGARTPTYASVHHVVSAHTVEQWIDHLVREKWQDVATAPRAAIAMCRMTGDRDRDVSERTRRLVDEKLGALGLGEDERRPLFDVVALRDAEKGETFGEALPPGLVLAHDV